jgi:peptide/nickel transport system substrate-binding protein
MKSKIVWLILSCLMVISMVLVSCGTKTTPTTTSTTTSTITTTISTTTPATTMKTTSASTTGNWFDKFGKPEYGGTLIFRRTADTGQFDPYQGVYEVASYYLETMSVGSWALDRKIYDFSIRWKPEVYCQGLLAESWEKPDWQTYVFHLRKGVRFQDKAPVNSREMTADDIVYTYNRMLGLGSGFTKPSPTYPTAPFSLIKSVTATDKYTVVFKLSAPSMETLNRMLDNVACGLVVPREAIEKSVGGIMGWKDVVGTGAFILNDYVSGSSITYTKNPNYWGYDERYPENKLPYVDIVKMLVIPDNATALAAVRTGKIDIIGGATTGVLTAKEAEALAKTNPEILQITNPANGRALQIRVDKSPFTDIRVRQALQMAIDLKTIAETLYSGTVEDIPYGWIGPTCKGYYTPFSDWPKDVKDSYAYNPEGAKKLLTEAGYPKGFKTNVVLPSNWEMDLAQTIKAYFAEIGVDMEIRVMDAASALAFERAMKHDAFSDGTSALATPPNIAVQRGQSTYVGNYTQNNDPVYDKMVDRIQTTVDLAEYKNLSIEANDYAIARHWQIAILPAVSFNVYQPWLKGYSGETYLGGFEYSHFWVDSKIKNTLMR